MNRFSNESLLDAACEIARDAGRVIEALGLAGLKVTEVRYRTYPGVAPGVVLRQTPPSGHRVSPRDPISLEVSKALEAP